MKFLFINIIIEQWLKNMIAYKNNYIPKTFAKMRVLKSSNKCLFKKKLYTTYVHSIANKL